MVLNTCTVTATADDELRQTVRRIHRESPEARILVTGCYAQRAPAEIAALPGVWLVAGNSHKTQIPDLISTAAPYHGQVEVGDIFAQHDFLSTPVEDALGDRTRPNLKIQDGCNNRCSFCIIPFVRGRSRSAPAEQVIDQVRRLAEKYKEVVLSGINLGRWGRDLGGAVDAWPTWSGGYWTRPGRAVAAQLGRADGFLGRASRPDGGLPRASRSTSMRRCNPVPTRCCDGCIASTGRGIMPTASPRPAPPCRIALLGADVMTGFPGRDRGGVRGIARVHRKPAVYVSARVHLFGAAGNARRRIPRASAHRKFANAARTFFAN